VRATILSLVVAVVAVAGACTGDGPEAAAPASAPASASAAGAEIRTFAFAPDPLEVEAGTTVTWTNRDDILHSVTGDDGLFGGDLDGPGSTYRFTFDEPGRYHYVCRIHDGMEGEVVVG
jgi:plastocyanin